MIRVVGWTSVVVALLTVGFGVGHHCAVRWGDPKLLAECAVLRIKAMTGNDPAVEPEAPDPWLDDRRATFEQTLIDKTPRRVILRAP